MRRLVAAAVLLPLLAACSSSKSPTAAPTPSDTAAPIGPGLPTTAAPDGLSGCVQAPPTAPAPAGSSTDLNSKPAVKLPAGPPPCGLQVRDIVVGHGAPARDGQQLSVRYVGVLYAGGQEFDASWKQGKDYTFPFPLGGHQVIPGWDLGMVGAKVGGRRELLIPASLGYGAQGSPPVIPPNAELAFVVDVVSIG